jgi:FkbM family methyltransferase
LHRTAGSKAVYANPPDYPEMLVWADRLKPGSLFVDVGANIGIYSVWAGELGASVIAIEPAEDTFVLLQENVLLNGYAVEMIQAAAGASPGMAKFTSGQDCVNHLDPHGNAEVNLITIDDLLGDRLVGGMKIDVEGFEIDVLRGCLGSLASGRIGLLQMEWNNSCESAVGSDRAPVADLLVRFGYRMYRPTPDGRLVDVGRYPQYGPDVFAMKVDKTVGSQSSRREKAEPCGAPSKSSASYPRAFDRPVELAPREQVPDLRETAGGYSVVGDEL